MPPELHNEQELNLKKRARRRLVGAIALVLLMVIVLPQVLQDRAAHTQQETIKITMPETAVSHKQEASAQSQGNDAVSGNDTVQKDEAAPTVEAHAYTDDTLPPEPALDNLIASKEAESQAEAASKPVPAPVVAKVENKKAPEVKTAEIKPVPVKPVEKTETKTAVVKAEPKSAESFTVQVGVYSDMANVKRIQDQLKQAGYSPATEKVTTAKGESVRLKAGNFKSREDAVKALDKLKSIGLSGIVIANN